ncbi:MAG: hypothetical protein ACPHZ7_03240 [Vibrio toranzoniae]
MAEVQEIGEAEVVDTEEVVKPVIVSVRTNWDAVKVGIEEILAEQPQLKFRPEDVYAACLKEEAFLWVAPEGFLITSSEVCEFTGARTLLLWLAWTKKRGESCAVKYLPFFEEVARSNGFQHIETRTPISALEDYFLAEGWTKDTVVYTRDL